MQKLVERKKKTKRFGWNYRIILIQMRVTLYQSDPLSLPLFSAGFVVLSLSSQMKESIYEGTSVGRYLTCTFRMYFYDSFVCLIYSRKFTGLFTVSRWTHFRKFILIFPIKTFSYPTWKSSTGDWHLIYEKKNFITQIRRKRNWSDTCWFQYNSLS